MNWDVVWQNLRYVLIAGGMFLAGRGKIDPDVVATSVDQIITFLSAAVAFGSWVWGVWVKWNTKAVSAKTAARIDVPTVSAATGAVQP